MQKAMRQDAGWDPATFFDSDLGDAVTSCVRAYESAWNDTFKAEDINAAQKELFSTIYAKCATPVVDNLNQ